MKQYRYIILLFFLAGIPRIDLWAQSKPLAVEIEKNSLKISARQLHFLSDKELEKLHNGLTVPMVMNITVVADHSQNPLYQAQERFVFSFDLWEEKYSVYHSPPDGKYVSHLSAAGAEEWCLKNTRIPLDSIPDQTSFVVHLECFIDENNGDRNSEDTSGLTFAGIIEYLSRRKSESPHHWKINTGFLRLDDLKRK